MNHLEKLSKMVLEILTTVDDQIKLYYIHNNKVDNISEIWFPQKITRAKVNL